MHFAFRFGEINDDRMALERADWDVRELLLEDGTILVTGAARRTGAALAPNIGVNGRHWERCRPRDKAAGPDILRAIPAERWGGLRKVESALSFLLAGPA